MRKSLLLVLIMPLGMLAGPVDVETARQQAANFFNQHASSKSFLGKGVGKEQSMQLLYAKQDGPEETPLLYVFGQEDGEGYVVIAGDDAATTPVLGYSKTGTFDSENIPENLRGWLDEYGKQLAFARNSSSVVNSPVRSSSRESIEPLITSKWGQGAPYNNLCPIDPNTGQRCVTGCMATALAQIMYYHKWPEQGVGSYSYEWQGQTHTANFGSTTYRWDKMKDTYEVTDNDPDDAVATLMYHCGVAEQTEYSSNESGVFVVGSNDDVLVRYFNYSTSLTGQNISECSSIHEHEETLYNELEARRPVLISGGTHMFICDGYENGYFHFNFGWNGSYDNYFLLSAINPAGKDYSGGHTLVYGIRKPGVQHSLNSLHYELYSDGTALLVRGDVSIEGELTIPSTIEKDGNNYEVKLIGNNAFYGCNRLYSVNLPNSVTSIGNSAFKNCTSLYSITIPNSVVSIGREAFNNCVDLASVIIPDRVKYIEESTFAECRSLTSATIPNSIVAIGNYAFQDCQSLSDITIPISVVEFGANVFEGCSSLAVPIYTSTVFISMPQSYEGEYVIPEGIITIAPLAFAQCANLTSVTIPSSVKTIGNYAFENCSGGITLPKTVTEIGSGAFSLCSGLTSVVISKDVTFIGDEAFHGCNNLNSIVVEAGNDIYDSRNDCNAIIETATNKLICGCNNTVIPNEITEIGYGAFSGLSGITTINIPNSVQKIGLYAFSGCSGLTSVEIPTSVTVIGHGAFSGCTSLISIQIPNSVRVFDSGVFHSCTSLKSITIPESLTFIPNSAFYGCSSLISVTIPNSVTEIQHYAFYGCSSLASITIPNSVTTINQWAFYGCRSLTSINIPRSVIEIDPIAFEYCSGLASILVEDGNPVYDSRNNCNAIIETVSNTLMTGCKNTTIPYNIKSIGPSAFSGCSDLTSLTIPESVTSIGEYAFLGCKKLQSLIIPKNVTTIGGWCFYECENLTTLTLPQNIASIGRIILCGSNSLKDLYCLATEVPKVVDDAFEYVDFENVTLHVPAESREDYWVTVPWSFFRKISPIIEGDVNADEEVDVLDVVDIARFVVGTPAITFMELFADINKDGNVNIGDAVVLVNVIAGNQDFASSRHVQPLSTTDALSLTEKEGRLSLSLENRCDYTAFQFDLYVPEDIEVKKILLNVGRKNGHQLLYNKVENGHYRVAALSTSNHTFNGDDGELLNIALDGMIGDATIISNVHFFDAKGNDYLFKEMDSTPTGIFEKENTLESIGGTIYDTQGRKLKHLQKGINIVEGKKVFVK